MIENLQIFSKIFAKKMKDCNKKSKNTQNYLQ